MKSYTFENGVIDLGVHNGTLWFFVTPMHDQYVGVFEVNDMISGYFGNPYVNIEEVIVADGHDIPSMLMGIADKLELLEEQSIEDYDTYEGEMREQRFKELRTAVQKSLAEQVKAKTPGCVNATA